MATSLAGITEGSEPPRDLYAPSSYVRFGVLPVAAAAASAALGLILALLLGVSPLLASAAGAAYFCIVVAIASVVFEVMHAQV